jgi:penicillin-binding protein 1A
MDRVEPIFDVSFNRLVDKVAGVERGSMARPRKSRRKSEDPQSGTGSRKSGSRRRGSSLRRLFYWSAVATVWALIGAVGVVAYEAFQLPAIDHLAIPKRPPNIAILADDGSVIANRGGGGPSVRLADLPPYLPEAFIAIEDRRFYYHWGVDPVGVLRAVVSDLAGHRGLEGGSTLTQQLARNLFLTQERTFTRKIQEAILAVWLEHKYSKKQILELYLNRVYFGSGAYGVDAAAEKYFGRSARDVTLEQAAELAGLMKAPTRLAPDRNPRGAIQRAAEVVQAMAEQGYVSPAAAKFALAHPAHATPETATDAMNYAVDYVMDQLADTVGSIDQDVNVRTTLDPRLEAAGQRALDGMLNREGARYRVSQGALVAIDPNGAIKALIGGRNYAESQFDRAVAARRQPGSTFKPFLYLAALERGLTPDSVRDDAPITLSGWSPEDAERQYLGPVTLTRALALSLNTVAVRLGLEVGPDVVADTAHLLGVTSDLQADPSIVLGTSDVTPLEMTSAYAPFANDGLRVRPHVILDVRTAGGRLLYRQSTDALRVIRPRYVAMMNAMMEQTLLVGTARRASLPGWQAAGKTGTSQQNRDAWFIGYTSHLIAGVWVGNDDSSPTRGASGANLPVAIWSSFMRTAHRGVPPRPLPSEGWGEPGPGFPFSIFPGAQPPSAPEPVTASDAPPPSGGGGFFAAPAPATPYYPRQRPSGGGALLPPADIPGGSGASSPPRQRSLLDAIFGG